MAPVRIAYLAFSKCACHLGSTSHLPSASLRRDGAGHSCSLSVHSWEAGFGGSLFVIYRPQEIDTMALKELTAARCTLVPSPITT